MIPNMFVATHALAEVHDGSQAGRCGHKPSEADGDVMAAAVENTTDNPPQSARAENIKLKPKAARPTPKIDLLLNTPGDVEESGLLPLSVQRQTWSRERLLIQSRDFILHTTRRSCCFSCSHAAHTLTHSPSASSRQCGVAFTQVLVQQKGNSIH
ncbi:hypothetical protein EYF80_011925 [Liparis tanakae]|uniref:Uncharacterized protein n=1 Tax=Liparis tanakae TaxID=230148 RepID=A0A4Z2IJ65_9TELE|nr:hypothetical protein EYF80_011925 [Liparis tanakae]